MRGRFFAQQGHDVLGEADLGGIVGFRRAAQHRMVRLEITRLEEKLQRLEPVTSCHDGELPAVLPDDKVVLQTVRLDVRGQLVDVGFVLRLAHVALLSAGAAGS